MIRALEEIGRVCEPAFDAAGVIVERLFRLLGHAMIYAGAFYLIESVPLAFIAATVFIINMKLGNRYA